MSRAVHSTSSPAGARATRTSNRRAGGSAPTPRAKARDDSGVRRRPTAARPSPPKNQRRRPPEPELAREPEAEAPEARRGRLRAGLAPVLRALRWVGRLLFAAACVAGVWAIFNLLHRHALTSPYFAVEAVEVEGAERLTEAELLSAAGLAVGQNVFVVSPAEARRRLEAEPWIESARVERRLPRHLRLSVVERHAAAILALSELYLVDRGGEVFSVVEGDAPVDLPVITGVDESRFRADPHYRHDTMGRAVGVLDDMRAAGLYRRMPIQEIHLGADGGLSMVMGAEALYVALGRDPYRPKLRRLRVVLDRLEARHERAERVFLDNERRPRRVVVRLRPPSAS